MPSTERRPSPISRLFLFLLAGVLLAAALVFIYSSILFSPANSYAGRYDVFRYYGPLTFYNDFSIEQGHFPLWNPMVYCGTPNLGNPQSFLYYPLNLLRSLLLPEVTPYNTQASLVVLVGVHLLLAGLFMYLLARAHRLGFAGAFTTALVFLFSALMVRRAAEYHFLFTIAWVPLVLLLIKHMLEAKEAASKMLYTLAAALFVGLAILGGFLQIIVYFGVTCAFYALLVRMLHLPRRWDRPDRIDLKSLLGDASCFAAIFVLAGCVAAVVLFTTGELSAFSARYKGTSVPMYSDLMKWDVTRVYQSLVVFPGMKYEAETARGAGVIAWLLVACGLMHRERKNVLVFAALLYVLVDCSFGPPFPIAMLVNLVTPFSSSAYSRAFDFCLLPLALLAGHGVDLVARKPLPVPGNAVRSLLLLYAAAATIIPLSTWLRVPQPHFLPVTQEVVVLPLLALVVLLVIPWLQLPKALRVAVAFGLAGLLFAEMSAWNLRYVPWMTVSNTGDSRDFEATGQHFPQTNTRSVDPVANRSLYAMTPVFNGVDPLHLAEMRDFLSGQPRSEKSHRLVTEWEPTAENQRGNLYLKRFFWLARDYVEAPVPGKEELFPSATTVFIESSPEALDLRKLPAEQVLGRAVSEQTLRTELKGTESLLNAAIQRKPATFSFPISLPREAPGRPSGPAGVLHSALVLEYEGTGSLQLDTQFVNSETGIMQWGKRTRFNLPPGARGSLQVPIPDFTESRAMLKFIPSGNAAFKVSAAYVLSDLQDEDGLLRIKSFTPNSVQLDVGPLDGPRVLSFLDANYPGWQVFVDGRLSTLLTTNHLFKGVALAAGEHAVEFRFSPRSFQLGLATTLVSTSLILLAMIYLVLRIRRGPSAMLAAPAPTPEPLPPAPFAATPSSDVEPM